MAAMMEEGARTLIDGVDRLAAAWVVTQVTTILDAWGQLDEHARMQAIEAARVAGETARTRVVTELRALLALAPAQQRATPLEVVRTLRREPTAVLVAAGVPEVERDPYEVRAFPDDIYGIVPHAITELGDDALGGALLAWGMGKAQAVQEAKNPGQGC